MTRRFLAGGRNPLSQRTVHALALAGRCTLRNGAARADSVILLMLKIRARTGWTDGRNVRIDIRWPAGFGGVADL
jgi:hypothetical protein